MSRWVRTGRGWWRLQLDRCEAKVLEPLAEVPGITVAAQREVQKIAQGVSVVAHRTAFFTEAMQTFIEATGIEPDTLNDDAVLEELWTPKRPLRTYQEEGARWLVAGRGGILGDAMGIGKSSQAVVAAKTLQEHAHGAPVLIVGPQFTRDVWRRELIALGAMTEDESDDGRTWFVCKGRNPEPGTDDAMFGARFVFCHYDVLEAWRHILSRPLRMQKFCCAIVDELHWIRNPLSKRGAATRAVVTLIPQRIGLTGTIFVNKVDDLWALFTTICGEGSFGTHFAFKSRYTQYDRGKYGFVSKGTRCEAELQARLEACYLRRTLADVGTQIPPLTRTLWTFDPGNAPMEAELKKYVGKDRRVALQHLREHFRRGAFGTETLKVLHAWRHWTSRQKLELVAERVASSFSEGESVIVFAWQRATVERLAELISKAIARTGEVKKNQLETLKRIFIVHGGYSQDARDQTVQQFQRCEGPAILCSTNEALKEGVTLTKARLGILVDLEWIPASMLQLEARWHRLGQTLPCESIWCVCTDSADEVITEHLMDKALAEAEALNNTTAQDAFAQVGLDMTTETREETLAQRLLDKWGGL
jgi:SNF2 family DNA or RNA helicase